jgi:hypothetical protein
MSSPCLSWVQLVDWLPHLLLLMQLLQMSLQAAREKLDSTKDNTAQLELENRALADRLVGAEARQGQDRTGQGRKVQGGGAVYVAQVHGLYKQYV